MKKVRNILFVCHGNICRSPMAEFIMKKMSPRFIHIESAATSTEEIGNHIYPPAKAKLKEKGIPFDLNKTARQMTMEDYNNFDMIIAMDRYNIRNILRIIGEDINNKVFLIMDFTLRHGDVSDPWYTGDFEQTYIDVTEGCKGLLKYIQDEEL